MTKPGTTRWKTTLSYQPHSASATKFPVAIGDKSALTLIATSPLSVLMVTVRVSPAASAGGCDVGQAPVKDGAGAAAEPLHAAISSGTASAAANIRGRRGVMRRAPGRG